MTVIAMLDSAIEDAMVLREEAEPHDGLAAGLVDQLTRLRDALAADLAEARAREDTLRAEWAVAVRGLLKAQSALCQFHLPDVERNNAIARELHRALLDLRMYDRDRLDALADVPATEPAKEET